MNDHLLLSATVMGLGMHLGAWMARTGDVSEYVTPELYEDVARTAEAGKLQAIFFADTLGSAEEGTDRPAIGALDPVILLSRMAAVTDRVGLVATASTTFSEPFDLARRFATLDHLTKGRAGWNVVATFIPAIAEAFGRELPKRDVRYERAEEFMDVVSQLWASWDEGALVGDKDAGIFADPAGVHTVDHAGEFFKVRGSLPMPRPPQGRPTIFQAGSSGRGRDFASHHSDVVFTAQNVVADAVEFRTDIRDRAASFGRDPDQVKVLPGLLPILGATEAEAKERKAHLDEVLGTGPELLKLARRVGLPVEELELDAPFPVDKLGPDEEFTGSIGFRRAAVNLAVTEGLTVRQLLARNGGGHLQVVGTAEQVADTMATWHAAGAVDGFNLMVDVIPSGVHDIVDMLVPELQRRGMFHEEYEHATLRENLGIHSRQAVTA